MADFASLANEVVTILQELETAAETVGEKFLAGGPEIENLAAESKQHVKELNEAVTSLDQRVTQTREKVFSQIDELKTKLEELTKVAGNFAKSTQHELSERETKVNALDRLLETKSEEYESLGDDVVEEIEWTKDHFSSSNKVMKDDFELIEKQLEQGQQKLDDMAEEIDYERNFLTDYIEQHFIEVTKEYTHHAESRIMDYEKTWYDEISATNKILSADLQSAVELLQATENESRDEIKAMAQEVEEAYDSEQVDAASKQAQQSTQKTSERMKQSESSFNEFVDSLSEVMEVLLKMVA